MEDSKEETSTNYIGLIIALSTLPVIIIFAYFGRYELGMNVAISLCALVFAVGICWDLRPHLWFWVVVALLFTIHVPLLLRIHWPPHVWVSKLILLPIMLGALAFDVGVIRFIQKFILKVPSDQENA